MLSTHLLPFKDFDDQSFITISAFPLSVKVGMMCFSRNQ